MRINVKQSQNATQPLVRFSLTIQTVDIGMHSTRPLLCKIMTLHAEGTHSANESSHRVLSRGCQVYEIIRKRGNHQDAWLKFKQHGFGSWRQLNTDQQEVLAVRFCVTCEMGG